MRLCLCDTHRDAKAEISVICAASTVCLQHAGALKCLLPCRDVETAPESASLEHVLEQLKKSKRNLLPIVDSQGHLVSMYQHSNTSRAQVVW